MGTYTPYILFVLANMLMLQVWLVKRSFAQETEQKLFKQAFNFYIEHNGKGAAIELNKENPAPAHIRPLLDDYTHDRLTSPRDRETLLKWAREVATNPAKPRDERDRAFRLVGAMGAQERLPRTRAGAWEWFKHLCGKFRSAH